MLCQYICKLNVFNIINKNKKQSKRRLSRECFRRLRDFEMSLVLCTKYCINLFLSDCFGSREEDTSEDEELIQRKPQGSVRSSFTLDAVRTGSTDDACNNPENSISFYSESPFFDCLNLNVMGIVLEKSFFEISVNISTEYKKQARTFTQFFFYQSC